MAGHRVSAERLISAPVERVWDVITDLEFAAEVLSGIVRIERVDGEGWEVGVRWRETRKMWGREETEEMWVASVDPLKGTEVRAASRGSDYLTAFSLEAVDGATLLHVDFTAQTPKPGPAQRLGWFFFGKAGMNATRKVLEQDLADIAAAAEGAPA